MFNGWRTRTHSPNQTLLQPRIPGVQCFRAAFAGEPNEYRHGDDSTPRTGPDQNRHERRRTAGAIDGRLYRYLIRETDLCRVNRRGMSNGPMRGVGFCGRRCGQDCDKDSAHSADAFH